VDTELRFLFFFPFSMTKTEMVDQIAQSAGTTKKAAAAALEAIVGGHHQRPEAGQ
jgi:hypothetical protein